MRGWPVPDIGVELSMPVNRVSEFSPNAEICLKLGPAVEPVAVNGALARTIAGGEAPSFRVEYLQAGSKSWWSLASGVAERMGHGHAPSGTWIVFLLIAFMVAVAALASRLVIRELR